MLLEVKEYYAELAQEAEEIREAELDVDAEYRELLWEEYERSIIEWAQNV